MPKSGLGWCYGSFSNAVSFDIRARVLYDGMFSLICMSYFFIFGLNIELWVNKSSVWKTCVWRDSSEGWVMSVIALSQIRLAHALNLRRCWRTATYVSMTHIHVVMSFVVFWTLSCTVCDWLQMTGCACISIWI